MGLKKFIKRNLFRLLYPLSKYYLSKERRYKYKDIHITVMPYVFHPGLFFSTKIILEYLEGKNLKGISLLELGAGTGIISIFCAKREAEVTATDISSTAIKNIEQNSIINSVNINIIQSDLFAEIPEQKFEWIIINPPYYPRDPINEYEQAWFCGSKFQFFTQLFDQLGLYSDISSNITMILSEDCDIKNISRIAENKLFKLNEITRIRKWGEWNHLYKIVTIADTTKFENSIMGNDLQKK